MIRNPKELTAPIAGDEEQQALTQWEEPEGLHLLWKTV